MLEGEKSRSSFVTALACGEEQSNFPATAAP
jgi:hypothetical protein